MFVHHVKQSDPAGCGVACVAMLTGNTFEYVNTRVIREPNGGTTLQELLRMLTLFGYWWVCYSPAIVFPGRNFLGVSVIDD